MAYELFGHVASSELRLPLPISGRRPSVEVVRGPVLEAGELIWREPSPSTFACFKDGEAVIVTWPEARFRVGLNRVVVDTINDASAADLLVPAVWSVLLALRGQEALHGCAVEQNGRALAILGASGAGKSTVGRLLIERGWRVVTDDLLTVDVVGDVQPGPPFLRLIPDQPGQQVQPLDTGGKVRMYGPSCTRQVSLGALIVLAPAYRRPRRLTGMAAVNALLSQIYNPLPIHSDHARRRFDLAIDLAGRVPVYGAPPRSLKVRVLDQLISEAFT